MSLSDEYVHAAQRLRTQGKPVTVAALASERAVEECAVRKFFRRNPSAVTEVGLESYEQHMRTIYMIAAALIRASRASTAKEVRTSELSTHLKYHSQRVRYFLKKYPDLARDIAWADDKASRR